MDEITSVFVTESREQLTALEAALLDLEANAGDPDTLNAVFRSAHTIKGGAGVVECEFIVAFTHVVENVLDKLRNGEIAVSGDLVAVLLSCADHIGHLLDVLEAGATQPNEDLTAEGATILARLQRDWLAQHDDAAPRSGPPSAREEPVSSSGGGAVETDCWHISLRFGPNVLRGGMDPLSFLRYLDTLGRIVHIETLADTLPAAEQMDPETCYLGFEINFASTADKAAIERVFDFVRDECELHILPPHSKLEDYLELLRKLPEDTMRLGEILVRIGALTQTELDEGLREQTPPSTEAEGGEHTPLGEILVEHKVVQPELVEAAVGKQKQVSEKKAAESRLIRIQADKLDKLIDLVGELVIAGASVNLLAGKSGLSDLVEATSLTSRLVESIRDAALQLRMVQIGETFNRFNRVVRDVSRELGKDIELVISGGETELDKSMVEKIGDPLMHLVRNAMDHGIESPENRVAHGKPARGRLELNAYHDSGSIMIEVVDDGGGLNRERIAAKAVERGIIQPGQTLSDTEIYNLIFEAGFSTAEQVSNLSGRGVGMDVVRRNIQSLRGTVEVSSTAGEGSRFAIRLPLTLAIIDGFLVGVGRAAYVIPLDSVVECIELRQDSEGRDYINLRGEVLPFVRLRDMFGIEDVPPPRQNVVVVQYGGLKAGIVVDQLMGEFQTVIKPLGSIFRHIKGIGGSTILGSGEVALILDVQALVQRCAQHEERSAARPQLAAPAKA
ncbi:chemotaxis protein CheA [Parazoarcus communis]|uniref:Chemotaxis protein CheA n=1 Tax=Parazoarcus communis SWub3 = DSM 12120 TaxID=1121029 RepID=A0A323UPQ0_9RHOO|nr:chemotaxis protein CheA [Parazoarcus communis]NMG72500.1 chemotaxis protein CheA [Parazoarcus communis SWub3 = DSM 12120]PZA14399.1 chemotaxis protein CheA [Azoarcus communis] [Parazoarcus communis SWub3 = DSM 12120]